MNMENLSLFLTTSGTTILSAGFIEYINAVLRAKTADKEAELTN